MGLWELAYVSLCGSELMGRRMNNGDTTQETPRRKLLLTCSILEESGSDNQKFKLQDPALKPSTLSDT